MFRRSNSLVGEPSYFHTHSEAALHVSLSGLWRRKLLICAIVATALGLGIIVALLMPPRYTAQAYIHGAITASDALAKDDEGRSAGIISLDLSRMIETQSILLQSHQMARRVVERLGLEKLQSEVGNGGWPDFYGTRADSSPRQEEVAATRLLRGLSVTTDPRAYLITVRYTARDPELADLTTNAFVAEILRSIKLQILSQQHSSTQTSLSDRLARYGNKYPRVIDERLRLQTIDSLLEKWQHATHDEILQAAGENVTEAIALPSSSRRFVIGLHVLLGILVGVGTALWLERGNWWRALSQRFGDFEAEGSSAISVSKAARVLVAARQAKRRREDADYSRGKERP